MHIYINIYSVYVYMNIYIECRWLNYAIYLNIICQLKRRYLYNCKVKHCKVILLVYKKTKNAKYNFISQIGNRLNTCNIL